MFLALATALYATGHSQNALRLDGMRLYGQALNLVTGMIYESKSLQFTKTMVSVYALSLFEVRC